MDCQLTYKGNGSILFKGETWAERIESERKWSSRVHIEYTTADDGARSAGDSPNGSVAQQHQNKYVNYTVKW